MWPRVDGLRAFGLGRPGEMRTRLNRLVLDGTKVATAGLWSSDYEADGEAIDEVGERQVLLDDNDERVAVVEVTRVETHRFADVPWEFADAEGEGFRDIQQWRDGHRSYYAREGITVSDDDLVVCVWFAVVD
jgi:uncharacterized protein YhfF